MSKKCYSLTRLFTGLAFGLIVVMALYLRGFFLLGVVLITCAMALWEFYSLFWGKQGRTNTRLCGIALGWAMLILTWMERPQDALVCLGAGFVLTALSFLFRLDIIDEHDDFAPGSIFMVGLAYVPLLLLPTTYLTSEKLFFVLTLVIISDASAYYVGVRYGRHKLWPRVSPNKSSEGSMGSLVGCVIGSVLLGLWLGSAPWWHFAILGVFINAFAQLGDLFESALKRAVNVKDSGSSLPGHGGFLDRIDSVLFALPAFAVVDQWFKFF